MKVDAFSFVSEEHEGKGELYFDFNKIFEYFFLRQKTNLYSFSWNSNSEQDLPCIYFHFLFRNHTHHLNKQEIASYILYGYDVDKNRVIRYKKT